MEKNFWISALQTRLNSDPDIFKKYTSLDMKLYIFGSALQSKSPHDLDIAILYHYSDIRTVHEIQQCTLQIISALFNKPIHCILLSYEEDEQVEFLKKEKAKLTFPFSKNILRLLEDK